MKKANKSMQTAALPALCVENLNVCRKFSGVSERALRVKRG